MSTTTTSDPAKRQLVWLVTGAASGLGRHLCLAILARGDKVIATTRQRSFHDLLSIPSSVPPSSKPNEGTGTDYEANFFPLEMDVAASTPEVNDRAEEAVKKWGQVDVVVNNAGCVFSST
jgi:NAD(P)-dependent dehydrogenase (short-subunit alcohol dehydrogenase family)